MTSLVTKCDVFFSNIEIQNTEHHLKRLIAVIPWEYPTFYGRPIKRGVCSMGKDYAFSGIVMKAKPWDPKVLELMHRINARHNTRFNACLLNYYPDGTTAISPHSDDESSLVAPVIVASVSLGATRTFVLESKDKTEKITVPLVDGSVLIMGDKCQSLYTHAVPKEPKIILPRVNLTFRCFA